MERNSNTEQDIFNDLELETLIADIDPDLNLSFIVGQEEAITVLRDLVKQITRPDIFNAWSVKNPAAIALTGAAGCGKTLAVRALSNDTDCPLMELNYEDLASYLYDDSISRLKEFKELSEEVADKYGHVLILIDEADALFQNRSDKHAHAADKKKTNFFLRWIDGGLESRSDFTILATSNMWENVDPALKRPGRFTEIKFNSLLPDDLLEVFKKHIELSETKVNRKMFSVNLADLDKAKLKNLTGACVKYIVDKLLFKRAKLHYDQVEDLDKDIDIDSIPLIDMEDLNEVLDNYNHKKNIMEKYIGF